MIHHLKMTKCIEVLYILTGICGYAWAGCFTCGNVLLNFSSGDFPINIARGSLASCLALMLPLFILPCRSCLHQLFARSSAASSGPEVHVYERSPTIGQQRVGSYSPQEAATDGDYSVALRTFETVMLLGTSTATTVVLDSVMMIWSIIGSTICILIGFTFPTAIWLRLKTDGSAWKVRTAQAILVSSVVFGVLCTVGAVINLQRPACPAVVIDTLSNATRQPTAFAEAAPSTAFEPNASLPLLD
jgi:amino acid permease